MALIISNSDFNKVANFFGSENVRRAKNGGTAIIIAPKNNVMNDNRSNTVHYALYLYEDGFRWRRMILDIFDEVKPYQLFRSAKGMVTDEYGYRYMGRDGYYVYESFETVEEALNRFMKYINRTNMGV